MTDLERYQEAVRLEGDPDTFRFYEKFDENGVKYTVGNYVSIAAKFPPIFEEGILPEVENNRKLLRDLRGLIFDEHGKIISRPLHKFFNMNEMVEHHYDNLPWDQGFEVIEKLDGSMVRPFLLGGKIRWGTKAGLTHLTPAVEKFVEESLDILQFSQFCIYNNITPIFEFYSPESKVVIDYGSKPIITLLAVRDNNTGEYYESEEFGNFQAMWWTINVAKVHDVQNHNVFLKERETQKGIEGFVVKFPDGRWVKIKSNDYVLLHKTRESIERERFVIAMTLRESIDDMLPLLPEYLQGKVLDYSRKFLNVYNDFISKTILEVHKAYNKYPTRKDLGLAPLEEVPQSIKTICFKNWPAYETFDQDIFNDLIQEQLKTYTIDGCESSEKNFKEKIKTIFTDLPEWDIFKTE